MAFSFASSRWVVFVLASETPAAAGTGAKNRDFFEIPQARRKELHINELQRTAWHANSLYRAP
jgi:hypothetical protein